MTTQNAKKGVEERPVLLVEDNPDDVDLTLRAFRLNRLANPVVVARDGQAALDYLLGEGEHGGGDPPPVPAVVLLDLRLPKVDGLQVLERIRAVPRLQAVPVIILTSSREDQDIARGYALGANSYVCKPVDFKEFLDAAKSLELYWLVMNVPPPQPPRA